MTAHRKQPVTDEDVRAADAWWARLSYRRRVALWRWQNNRPGVGDSQDALVDLSGEVTDEAST